MDEESVSFYQYWWFYNKQETIVFSILNVIVQAFSLLARFSLRLAHLGIVFNFEMACSAWSESQLKNKWRSFHPTLSTIMLLKWKELSSHNGDITLPTMVPGLWQYLRYSKNEAKILNEQSRSFVHHDNIWQTDWIGLLSRLEPRPKDCKNWNNLIPAVAKHEQ